ncbi:hypothetical protein SAMN04489798_2302 [Pseudomonas arsenicoxydans]|uniref:Uncharacterized protein n=1 Tax=Pseudomonas arsenicoxydans TaxID=702115 RepID=A0A1H0HLH5_9PSED|nr:hypothetical protein [Pseudomonas arsenicoxydans]SDO19957.1 hypothetical protein SAMN04489798_2302 [Pseudomonas arsenicoxydans]
MSAELATETKKKFRPLDPICLSFEDYRYVRHCAIVPRDTDPQMLTESGLWLSVAHRLHPLDRICVVYEDRSAMAELMVLEASQSFTSLVMLSYTKLPGIISDGSEALINFEIFYSQMDGYCARRLSDSVLIVKGATSKEKAIEELKSHPSFKAE